MLEYDREHRSGELLHAYDAFRGDSTAPKAAEAREAMVTSVHIVIVMAIDRGRKKVAMV